MYCHEKLPSEWFSSRKRPRSYYHMPPMSRPVSKNFNRISDFIFPDTIHVRLHHHHHHQQQRPVYRHYQRAENFSLPILNRHSFNQHDLVVVERLPFQALAHGDFLYREQQQQQQQQQQQVLQPQYQQQQRYASNQQVRRRYSSIIDERRAPFNDKTNTGLATRSAAYRERMRDRRKRHTTDNAYHSLMKSMLEEDEAQILDGEPESNYMLSYTTTLDPISDSESMASLNHRHQQQQPRQQIKCTNAISSEEWNQEIHNRVPVNGTVPVIIESERPRQRQHTTSTSSRDSSSDTVITERHPTKINSIQYQQDSSFANSLHGPPAIPMPHQAVWERLQSDPIRFRHQPDMFIPITPATDTNHQETTFHSNNPITASPFDNAVDYQTNNPTLSQQENESVHHVSLCVNDLHTTLFIDEDALYSTKTSIHSNNCNNNGKATIKTFIDRIIKRLQHFKRSLDAGLIHVRKRNTLVNGPILTADYHEKRQITKRNIESDRSNDDQHHKNNSELSTYDENEENKLVRPYFLIRPQSVLLLPNETAKFKCCFGGDPHPTIVWSHNDSRISEIVAAGDSTSTQYKTYKLHDIYYLDIGPVSARDGGQIKCTIMNRYGREETIAQLTIISSASDATPRIVQSLDDITIIEGRPLKLSCSIVGLQVSVNWFHNGKLISSVAQVKTDYNGENAVFTLSRCMRTDAGTLDCVVKNRFGEARTGCRIVVANDPEFDR